MSRVGPRSHPLVHLRPSHEFHPSVAVHLPAEAILEERVKNVRLQHLQTQQQQMLADGLLPASIETSSLEPASPHLPVEKLFGRLSSCQELFAVEHSMLVVQMAADVPVHQTPFGSYAERRNHHPGRRRGRRGRRV